MGAHFGGGTRKGKEERSEKVKKKYDSAIAQKNQFKFNLLISSERAFSSANDGTSNARVLNDETSFSHRHCRTAHTHC